MNIIKPDAIAVDPFKSSKWDELTEGRAFAQSDIPPLTLLCQWYAVVERCMADLDFGGNLPQVAYQNDIGDLKAMPQLATMKQASAEIRALNKQLGINDEARAEVSSKEEVPLVLIRSKYKDGRAGASGSDRAG